MNLFDIIGEGVLCVCNYINNRLVEAMKRPKKAVCNQTSIRTPTINEACCALKSHKQKDDFDNKQLELAMRRLVDKAEKDLVRYRRKVSERTKFTNKGDFEDAEWWIRK